MLAFTAFRQRLRAAVADCGHSLNKASSHSLGSAPAGVALEAKKAGVY